MDENDAIGIALAVIGRHHGEAKRQSGDNAGNGNNRRPWVDSPGKAQKPRRIGEKMDASACFFLLYSHLVLLVHTCCGIILKPFLLALLQSHSESRRAGPRGQYEKE
jgi:hypothetical protein